MLMGLPPLFDSQIFLRVGYRQQGGYQQVNSSRIGAFSAISTDVDMS